MARQLLMLFVLGLMVYTAPVQANDDPLKNDVKSEVQAQVLAPSFSELVPGGGGNPFPNMTSDTFSSPSFGDIDGDGDLDMFSGNEAGTISFFENTGNNTTPSFVQQTGVNNPLDGVDVGDKSSAALVDIDGDGDLDMFIGEELGAFSYYENTGDVNTPTFAVGGSNPMGAFDVGNRSQVTFVDLDADGDYDAVSGEFSGTVNYFENTGTNMAPTFNETVGGSNPFNAIVGATTNSAVALGDIDNDLDYDLVMGDKDGGFRYFENTGSTVAPAYTEVTGVSNPLDGFNVGATKESAPAIVDLNNGNGVDVISGNTDGDFYYYINADPLPVELSSFNAVRNLGKITLTWTTASETNNAGFEVQTRTSRGFEAVAFVPGAGTTTEARSYSFTIDQVRPGRQSFRLKQVDFDGAFDFSSEASVSIPLESSFLMTPTSPEPFNPQATFNLTVASSQQVTIGVYDMQGRMVELLHSGELESEQPYQFYVTANDWASGKYIIRAIGEAFQASQMITLLK
ncbi:MAG: FG-GAP-like repeat-containing protein [Rhodothermales bacterium]